MNDSGSCTESIYVIVQFFFLDKNRSSREFYAYKAIRKTTVEVNINSKMC